MHQKSNRFITGQSLICLFILLSAINNEVPAQIISNTENGVEYTIASGWWDKEAVWGHFEALGLIEEAPCKYTAPEGVPYPTAYNGGIFILDFMPQGEMNAEKFLDRIGWVLGIRINDKPLNLSFTLNLWTRDSVIIQRMKDGEIPFYDERVASGDADSALFEIRSAIDMIAQQGERDISFRFMQEHVSGIHSEVVKGEDSWRNAWERAQSILDSDDQLVWIWHPNHISREVREKFEPRDWDAFSSSTYQTAALSFLENSIQFADTLNKPFIHIECGFSGIKDEGNLNDNAETYLRPLTEILEAGINDRVVKGVAWQNRAEGWFSNKDGVPWADAVIHKYDEAFKVWKDFLETNLITSIEEGGKLKNAFKLSQNYPNPFNPSTIIEYSIPQAAYVQLKVFDILGCEIVTLVDEYQDSGSYSVELTAHGLASGVYLYELTTGDFVKNKKMILTR